MRPGRPRIWTPSWPRLIPRSSGVPRLSQIQEIRDLEESVLLLGHLDVAGRTTGIELSQEFGQLVTFRGGKILRSQDFLSHAEALEAAGLSE